MSTRHASAFLAIEAGAYIIRRGRRAKEWIAEWRSFLTLDALL